MKRLLLSLIIAVIILAPASGCSRQAAKAGTAINVVCTIFPQYDWVKQIIGDKSDNFELTLLQTGSTDLHNFQPSVGDIVKISSCDLFIYVGGESDAWVADALEEAVNEDMIIINLLELLGSRALTEELTEGMQEEEHEHEEHGHEEEAVADEHVWLSLNNAKLFCTEICGALSRLDTVNAKEYAGNLNAYNENLTALDGLYRESLADKAYDTLIFGDRFPFRYLVNDYGLKYYAAFPGCSADTEAGFETIIFLADKLDELGLNTIMVTESSNQSVAKLITENTAGEKRILPLNSMQSAAIKDADNGVTYMSIMKENMNMLIEATGE